MGPSGTKRKCRQWWSSIFHQNALCNATQLALVPTPRKASHEVVLDDDRPRYASPRLFRSLPPFTTTPGGGGQRPRCLNIAPNGMGRRTQDNGVEMRAFSGPAALTQSTLPHPITSQPIPSFLYPHGRFCRSLSRRAGGSACQRARGRAIYYLSLLPLRLTSPPQFDKWSNRMLGDSQTDARF